MNRNFRRISTALLFSLTLFAFVPAKAADTQLTRKQLKTAIENAKTPAQHRAIADYYRQQAQRLSAKSKEHQEMAQEYLKHPLPFEGKQVYGTVGASHCRSLADNYANAAKNAEELAALHDEMAKEAAAK